MSIRSICNALNKPVSPKTIAVSFGMMALMSFASAKYYQMGVPQQTKDAVCVNHVSTYYAAGAERDAELAECLANAQSVYFVMMVMGGILLALGDALTMTRVRDLQAAQQNRLKP